MGLRNKSRPALAIRDVVIIKGKEQTGIYGDWELLLNSSKERMEPCVQLKSDVENQN